MIRKVLNSIRHIHPISGFDSYFSNVQMHVGVVAPTVDEAKKDFRSRISAENAGYRN